MCGSRDWELEFCSFEPQFPHLLSADIKHPALQLYKEYEGHNEILQPQKSWRKHKRSLYKRKDFLPLPRKWRSSAVINVHRLIERKREAVAEERTTYRPMQQCVDEVLKRNMEPAKPDIQSTLRMIPFTWCSSIINRSTLRYTFGWQSYKRKSVTFTVSNKTVVSSQTRE